MKPTKTILSGLFFLFIFTLQAQPFEKAPQISKKTRRITEWIRPNLKVKSVKGMVSTFNRSGQLISYTDSDDASIFNTHQILDTKGRIIEKREGKGSNLCKTRFFYKKDRTIEESSFRGKVNRHISFFNKKGVLVESKNYAKGLELGNAFRLKERILFKYNRRGQLIGEKIMTYNMVNVKKFNTRKKRYHYHPDRKYLIKVVDYDYDGTTSVVKDYGYHADRKIKSIITNFIKDQTLATQEFLYKDGKIWQEIYTERGFRNVKIYADGRLVRLRSYNEDKISRVVDYQYEYFRHYP